MSDDKGPLPPPPSYDEAQKYVTTNPQGYAPQPGNMGYPPYPSSSTTPGAMPQPGQASAPYQPAPSQSYYPYSGGTQPGYQPTAQPPGQVGFQPQMGVASPYTATTQPYPGVTYTHQGQSVVVPSGYTTTPLAYGNQNVYDTYRRKRIVFAVICIIFFIIIVSIIFTTIW